MKQYYNYVFVVVCVVMLFLGSSLGSGAAGFIQTARQDSPIKKNLSTNNEVMVSCVAGGIPIMKQISVESCQRLQQLFSALVEANAHNPCGENTRVQKVRFIEMLADLGLIAHDISAEEICSLIEPPWSHHALSRRWGHRMQPRSLGDENNATLLFCSMAGTGWGFVIPPILLPRPRLVMQWRGFYPDSSAVSVAEMATGRGVIARGTQVGTAFGFIGVGFAFAFPGAPAQFGFLGYSLMTKLQAADMDWYYANFPPLVMDMSPEDGAVEVPVSLSELRFTLKDYDFDKMTYNVVTSPDIGSGADANVGNGAYSIPVSGLESGTTYTWTVTVSDETETIEDEFTFTTEAVAPIISDVIPLNGDQYVPVAQSSLRFHLRDPQNDPMSYTVETSPFIGSGSGSGVDEGDIVVPISGLEGMTEYHWFVNVTDGENPTSEEFWFRTEPLMVFDPFEEGWEYRKMITVDHTMVAGELENFPVLLDITDTDLQDKAQDDGDDILFMNGAGVATRLYHELEDFDGSTGQLIAWVNIGSLSSTVDTSFYMYYGNMGSSDQQCPEKVWDSNYKIVYHLKDLTSSSVGDSTVNNNHGTKKGGNEPNEGEGKIGKGQNFDYVDDRININSPADIAVTQYTLSAYIYLDQITEASSMIQSFFYKASGVYYGYSFMVNSKRLQVTNLAGGGWGTNNDFITGDVLTQQQWYYVAATYDGTTARIYLNGSLIGSKALPTPTYDTTKRGHIGVSDGPGGTYRYYMDGIIDEVRISSSIRSGDWILTEYNNQNNPSGFYDVGVEEPHP